MRQITWTPDEEAALGDYTLNITATDKEGNTGSLSGPPGREVININLPNQRIYLA